MASDAKACFSSKFEYRAVIRYLYLKGKTSKEIHGELADVYGSSPVSILYKSIAGRYRPVRVADGPITARYRFIKNASWVCTILCSG